MEDKQPEQEHEQAQQQADELEEKAEELDERKDEFASEVTDVKHDWEQKQQAGDVPGAQDESGAGMVLGPETGEEPPRGAGGEGSDRGEESDADADEGGDDAGT